jgi:Na+/proline symporter
MPLVQLSQADWWVLGGYLLMVLTIGAAASSKIKSSEQYFLGNRSFGKWIMIAQSFGTGTHAEMPVSLAGAVYAGGLSSIWFQWKNLFVTPFYWLLAPLFRRFRRTTMAEVVSDRYGPWMGALYTAFALCFFTINLASMLKGAAKVIDQSVGGHLPVNAIVVGMACIFVLYSFLGGLVAAAWTEVFQGFLIITLSFMVIPNGWDIVGGMEGMRRTLGAERLSLVVPHGIGLWFILVLTLNGLVGIIAQPHLIAAVGTGKDENSCRVGQFYGNMVKRVCTVGWAIVGLITAAVVAKGTFGVTHLSDPEEAFGFACRHLLFPGGVGLLIACLLAANMAGCSAFMVNSGALFTNGFYRKYVTTVRSDGHYLWVGRISGLIVTIAAVAYAVFLIDRVLNTFLLTETMATFFGISILAGVVWRRANRWGALMSIVVSMGVNFAGHAIARHRLDHWDPTIFIVALVLGVLTLVMVSLLTTPEPGGSLERFFAQLQTPSDSGETTVSPATAAQHGRQLILVNLLDLRAGAHGTGLLIAYRADLRGLFNGSVLVCTLVALVWLWIRFG